MKKLTVLLLTIGFLFSMSACSSKIDDAALDKIEDLISENNKVKSANYQMDIAVNNEESDTKIKISGGYLENKNKTVDLSFSADMQSDGQTFEDYIQMYLVDNIIYINIMDAIKEKTDIDTFISSNSSTPTEDKLTIDKETMKSYLTEASLNGNSINLVFDDKKINDQLKKSLEGADASSYPFTLSSMEANIDTENNLLKKAIFKIQLNMADETNTQDMNLTISLSMKDYNKVNTLDIPDLSDYEDTFLGQSL